MSKKKKFKVLAQDGVHEYDLIVKKGKNKTKTSIHLSNGNQWNEHAKGQHELTMVNDGDGVTFDRDLKTLNYGELACLRILLNFENQTDPNPINREKYTVVKKKVIAEV